MESHNKKERNGLLLVSVAVLLLCLVAIASMVGKNNKAIEDKLSEVVNATDGSIDIPNTNQTCLRPNITDDGFYCNVDDIVDR